MVLYFKFWCCIYILLAHKNTTLYKTDFFCVCLSCILGEGNGTPLQYSCLENPMDGGSWCAAVHGVPKSRTRRKKKESDTTEQLQFHFSLSYIGEGNGNPLQCSCLENPRDPGAWWAAVYGVAQSWTLLKWLSSSILYSATLICLLFLKGALIW